MSIIYVATYCDINRETGSFISHVLIGAYLQREKAVRETAKFLYEKGCLVSNDEISLARRLCSSEAIISEKELEHMTSDESEDSVIGWIYNIDEIRVQ